jgi:hypothetical protein
MTSFLASALGAAATPLLKEAGGYLLDKGSSLIKGIGSYFTSAFGGPKGTIGKTVMDRMYDHGVNASMDGIQKFAKSDFLQRKMPMLAPALSNAADHFKTRLSGTSPSMPSNNGPGGMDGIERMKY